MLLLTENGLQCQKWSPLKRQRSLGTPICVKKEINGQAIADQGFSIASQAPLNLEVVNEHSKWLELLAVLNLTSQTTIDTLCTIFATHGLPELLALDNGSSFSSTEFKELMEQKWNLPYHITCVLPSFQWPG